MILMHSLSKDYRAIVSGSTGEVIWTHYRLFSIQELSRLFFPVYLQATTYWFFWDSNDQKIEW